MYKSLIRPVLFLFDPEYIHKAVIFIVKTGCKIPFILYLIRKTYIVKNPKLVRNIWGLKFENPVGLAAGFDKNAVCFNELANFGFSFIEIGTVTPVSQPGNPKPRMFRLKKDKGLINRMGFNNSGVNSVISKLKNKKTKIIIGGNIGKNTKTANESAINDYIYTFNELYEYVDYLVINVSCPNINNLSELQDGEALKSILTALNAERSKRKSRKPVLLKISPDLTFNQIDEIIDIVISADIDGFVATNTSIGRNNLTISDDKIAEKGFGGLSGSPITSRSTEIIKYITDKTKGTIPVIGVGGIMSADDAIEKIHAGATLVQVYTGFIYEGPMIVKKINKALLNI